MRNIVKNEGHLDLSLDNQVRSLETYRVHVSSQLVSFPLD